jgi:hypothetical protein
MKHDFLNLQSYPSNIELNLFFYFRFIVLLNSIGS